MLPADTSLIDALVAALPEGSVITNPASMDAYRWDRANDPNAGTPLVVVRVTSTEEVQTVVRLAAAANVPIVPRGAGSGLSGGSTAINGCIVLSLDRMREITVDPVTRTVVSQPGAFNAEVKAAAADLAAKSAEQILTARVAGQAKDPLLDAAIGQIGDRLN